MSQKDREIIAVLISDVHYNVDTKELADKAMRQAIKLANDSKVPLVMAGDLHDTKAKLDGTCVKMMLNTIEQCLVRPYILIGNHDRINEKSSEHSLEFLRNAANIIVRPITAPKIGWLIPYDHDPENLRKFLAELPAGSRLIMHQGVQGAKMGDYVIDKSSLPKECYAKFQVISGHYHPRQSIVTGGQYVGSHQGTFQFIGNPFSLGFSEAVQINSDGSLEQDDLQEKGFQILYEDGTLEFVPTNLRKHIRVKIMVGDLDYDKSMFWQAEYKTGDLVWVTVRGHRQYLDKVTRQEVADALELPSVDFKLDFEATDEIQAPENEEKLTQHELLDNIIDGLKTDDEQKARLKELWRRACVS